MLLISLGSSWSRLSRDHFHRMAMTAVATVTNVTKLNAANAYVWRSLFLSCSHELYKLHERLNANSRTSILRSARYRRYRPIILRDGLPSRHEAPASRLHLLARRCSTRRFHAFLLDTHTSFLKKKRNNTLEPHQQTHPPLWHEAPWATTTRTTTIERSCGWVCVCDCSWVCVCSCVCP